MKKIIYYITDHGMGHATRSIAIIRKLQELGIEVIVRNSNSTNIIKKSLPNTEIITGLTDVGPIIESNGISINQKQSEKKIVNWLENMDKYVKEELKTIHAFNPNLVVSDISILPLITAKKMKKISIAISNFTWYDVLKFLPLNYREFIKKSYSLADYVIKLPIGTKMSHFQNKKKVGYVSRTPMNSKKNIRKKLGIEELDIVVTFALGGSNEKISCKINNKIKILSMNSKIDSSLNFLDVSNWIEGQDIVQASDVVICKCGYGLISECITSGTSFCYVVDETHQEQLAMHEELSKNGWGKKIQLGDINQLTIDKKFLESIPTTEKQPNDIDNTVKYITNKLI